MLQKLTIEQFVIIDKLDLDFQNGLTILTGETGAGKSILLDATGLMLGEPADYGAIRQGADQSVIRALFSPPQGHPVWAFLEKNDLTVAGQKEFWVHRVIKRTQQDEEIRLNDKPLELELLRKAGTYLAEIHGQFANQSLLDPDNQLNLLDLSGGFPPEVFTNVSNALADVHRYTRELEEENIFLNSHKRSAAKIEELVNRFEKVGMKEGYIEEVTQEYSILLTAKETSQAFQNILAQLIAANGVVLSLSGAHNTLTKNKNLDAEKMANLANFLAVALENSRAAVTEMRRLAPDYDIDTQPLERLGHVLDVLEGIADESKIAFEDLTTFYMDLSTKLKRIKNGRETLVRLEESLAKAKRSYLHHAHVLSELRMEAGKKLSEAITSELPPLKLPKAEFVVKVVESHNLPWTDKGLNEVTFTARMNPGQPFSPVSETASGGELARLILALKVVVQKVQTIPTLIFDEVDTGIGGAAAAAVGERLALLADNTQVLVITHSPQVASRGHQHLYVSKKTDGVTTTSVVNKLTMKERLDEISRMLAGDTITAEALAAAQSLINEAENAAAIRKKKAMEEINA